MSEQIIRRATDNLNGGNGRSQENPIINERNRRLSALSHGRPRKMMYLLADWSVDPHY